MKTLNQILDVDKKKKSGKLETNKAVKICAIAILVFGIILAIFGVYKIFTTISAGKKEPIIEISEVEGKLQLKVVHNKAIDKIIYSWNSEGETVLQGKNRSELVEIIKQPYGNNILNLKIIDQKSKNSSKR